MDCDKSTTRMATARVTTVSGKRRLNISSTFAPVGNLGREHIAGAPYCLIIRLSSSPSASFLLNRLT